MKLLVIGGGSIGQRHLANAAALAEKAAIFDRDTEKAARLAQQHGAEWFATLEEALQWGADGAVIATPHDTHIALARLAVEAGCHALIEKPISHREEEATAFLAHAAQAKRQVFTVCNMRFHPAIKALKDNLPRLGKVYYARAHYGNYLPNMRPGADYRELYCARKDQGGGVIFDVIHEIDYLGWFLGPVQSLQCAAGRLSQLQIDVEDYAAINAIHSSGVRSEIHMDYLQQCKRRGCEIIGEKGTLLWRSEGKNPEHCEVRFFDAGTREWSYLLNEESLDASPMYREMMQAFIDNIGAQDNRSGLLDGETAIQELKTALAAHEAAAQGKTINL